RQHFGQPTHRRGTTTSGRGGLRGCEYAADKLRRERFALCDAVVERAMDAAEVGPHERLVWVILATLLLELRGCCISRMAAVVAEPPQALGFNRVSEFVAARVGQPAVHVEHHVKPRRLGGVGAQER